jgi:hypothetical protein
LNTGWWEVAENFTSDTDGSSVLECQIYAKRKFGSDELVGATKRTTDSFLAQGPAGGQSPPTAEPLHALHLQLSAVIRHLCKHDANGALQEIQTIVEFTKVQPTQSATAAAMRMDEAVAQAKHAFEQMKLASSSLGHVQGSTSLLP